MRFDGQQRVMRLSGAPLGSPAERRVLTNRMRENFTYGSVGGAEGNLGSYPAAPMKVVNPHEQNFVFFFFQSSMARSATQWSEVAREAVGSAC